MVLLSIIIPTYSRSKLLNATLNSLLPQLVNVNLKLIEIIISDNCSFDDTEHVVSVFKNNNPCLNIRYNKNSMNLGFDKNCMKGASLSKGKFIWFMSDDDELKEDAINILIENLKKYSEVGFVFLNYTLKTPGWEEGSPLFLTHNQVVDCNNLMKLTKYQFSCITSCVFNRIKFNDLDLNKFLNTHWVHVYIVKLIASTGMSLIISKPIFVFKRPSLKESRMSANRNKLIKRDFFIDAHINFIKFLASFDLPYTLEIKEHAFAYGWSENFKQILSYKLTTDNYNKDEIKSIYDDLKVFYSKKINFWLFHVPVLYLPKTFSTFFFFNILVIKKLKSFFKPYVPKKVFIFYKNKFA
jgi:glycosyltransferase involved in cell wall biosynthesis